MGADVCMPGVPAAGAVPVIVGTAELVAVSSSLLLQDSKALITKRHAIGKCNFFIIKDSFEK